MTFLTAKPLPRRTILRGLGADDGAAAARCHDARASSRAAAKPVHRFQTFYVPNGMAMEYWLPKTEGADFELTPILEPLAPFRNQMLVLSGLKANWNYIHAGASGSFLTGTTRGGRNEVEIIADVSMDQLLARHFAQRDAGRLARARDGSGQQRRRLHRQSELRLHAHAVVAQPDAAAADGVQPARGVREAVRRQRQHRSGRARSAAAAAQEHPRFGQREARQPASESLGPQDQVKVNEYAESVRDVERRIQRAEEQRDLELPAMDQPQGVPPVFEDHLALMLDLQVLAFQSDLTRVISFMISKEQSARPYPQIGVPEAHHPLSHHGDQPELIARMSKINRYHTELFAKYLSEAARHAGRRRLAARSHDDPVRLGHLQQQPALGRQPADPVDGRRRRHGSRAAGTSPTPTSRRWRTCWSR